MNPQNIGTYKAEKETAGKFHFSSQARSQPESREDTAEADEGGDDPRSGGQNEDGSSDSGETDSHCKGINRRGNGHGEEGYPR